MSACAQWDDCDLGLVNDSYPGSCGKYIDTNNDGICDHSQEQPTTTITQKTQVTSTTQAASPPRAQRQYNLLALAAGLIALYLLSYGLTKTKHLSLVGQRKIWNVFLTASFIAVALTAFFIAVRIEFGQNISIIPDNSYWHIEFGVAMIVIAVFHALWHWRYYLALLKRK